VLGIHACNLGVPILAEELARFESAPDHADSSAASTEKTSRKKARRSRGESS
jgi:hypothetical protein